MSATNNLQKAEHMIREVMNAGQPAERTLEICRWLFAFNAKETTHCIKCYKKNDNSIRFCFDRGGDCDGEKIAAMFVTIRRDFAIKLRPKNTDAPYLNPDGIYYRINSGDALDMSTELLKEIILEAYYKKLHSAKFGLTSVSCVQH